MVHSPVTPLRRSASNLGPITPSLLQTFDTDLRGTAGSSLSHASTLLEPLTPLFSDLTDETDGLLQSLMRMKDLDQSLSEFNEAFANFLLGLRLDAYCVSFLNAPDDATWSRAKELVELESQRKATTQEALHQMRSQFETVESETQVTNVEEDASFNSLDEENLQGSVRSNLSSARAILQNRAGHGRSDSSSRTSGRSSGPASASQSVPASKRPSALSRPSGIPNASAAGRVPLALKKRRERWISDTIDGLPLDWRGADSSKTQIMSTLLNTLAVCNGEGTLPSLESHSKLKRVHVNLALQALVKAKRVEKIIEAGQTFYLVTGGVPTAE